MASLSSDGAAGSGGMGSGGIGGGEAGVGASDQDQLRDLPSLSNGYPGVQSRYASSSQSLVSERAGGLDGPNTSSASRPRPERRHSGRVKREHNHHRSQSRHHGAELKTVGEYALHHLFNSFVGHADQKIGQCVADVRDGEPRVELICGPGVDPAFDQLISALGHIARQKPKPLIDTLMFWRKSKSEAANQARIELNQAKSLAPPHPSLPRRATEPVGNNTNDSHSPHGPIPTSPNVYAARQVAVIQAERRSSVSIYLLCRVLKEIIGQSSLASVTPEMADRLEDIIYTQLCGADPSSLQESPLKLANWLIFAELLGVMSDINFESVSQRFVRDLEKFHPHLGDKGPVNREIEGRAILIVRGMRDLRVKTTPDEAWDKSCDFLLTVGRLFAEVHGQPLKVAYCRLFRSLLLSIAADTNAPLGIPKWRSFVEATRGRVNPLLQKPKYWQDAFPLAVALLCSSPLDSFAPSWSQLVQLQQPRLRERVSRPIALQGICQLVWTYLYRGQDAQSVSARKIEDVIRLVFQPGKRSILSTDSPVAEPLIQLIRIIGFKHQDLCFRTIIFPLMNAEVFTAGSVKLRVESLDPEKMVIGIRAFLAIMSDLENGEVPPFPTWSDTDTFQDALEPLSMPLTPRLMNQVPTKSSTAKEDRLSRPVLTAGFAEVAKEYYVKFCKILGEITIICDEAFGGQAVLDEKFSVQAPKTPLTEAFSFSRREDHQGSTDPRQGFYDLLHIAVQALPRCLSPHIPFNSLVNLLCTGTAHVQSNIASSSSQSLKAIAKQSHAQQVTIGFARFIFNFDNRYSTLSDGGMLGPGHIESTLKLYIELLEIWIEEIKQKTKRTALESNQDTANGSRGNVLDLSGTLAHVDEVESHGLFFLCSPSRLVRGLAITVLRLISEFDTAVGKDSDRIIGLMERYPHRFMNVDDEKLTLAERSRLQRGLRKSNLHGIVLEVCGSDLPIDSGLWFKMFPSLVRECMQICPSAVTMTRDIVCARLSQMQRAIGALADGTRSSPYTAAEAVQHRLVGRIASTAPEIVIDQWKLYLIFACTSLTNLGGQQQAQGQMAQHLRKPSKSSPVPVEKINSAAELFARVIPFLSVENEAVRDAVVVGLGAINKNLYRTLLESLQSVVTAIHDEAKTRMGLHQRTMSSPRRFRPTNHLRTEVTHVYKLTSHFLHYTDVYNDEWILTNLVNYTKDIRLFLADVEVQNEWEFQKLRIHYCGLVEELFEGINRNSDPIRWMPFQARKAAFALMEEWCGYSPNQPQIQRREDTMRRSMLERVDLEIGSRGVVSAAMEIEKKNLRTAALSSMASLCGGPVSIRTDSKVDLQFDVRRMLSWVDTIFDTLSDTMHGIGRRALKNLIVHNKEHPLLLDRAIEMCFTASSPKALESYFDVVTQVLTESTDFSPPFYKVLVAGLYTLGNESNVIRMKSARLLRTLEERQQKNSKLQDLDISISDKTIAVYKLAQFEMSRRLAQQHAEIAFFVLSEFALHFKDLMPDHQRNIVAAMLPWIQTVELQLDPNGGPTAQSYMLLINLFEITVRCGNALHNEIQALWQALATGPHAGNVQLVLDFIISLCLEKREQNFVDYAKQIVVYLSSTPAGLKVVEFLLLQINPKAMVFEKREVSQPPPDPVGLPYLADISVILPTGNNKQAPFSLGHLCLILLVDLMVSPVRVGKDKVPLLLQVVLVLWDHYTPLVQDQAQEMLVHLIHELVISKLEEGQMSPDKQEIEDFVEMIRRHDAKVGWNYEDFNGKNDETSGNRVPEPMEYVATEVARIFSISYPGIREEWCKTTLQWATSCPVKHLACRSFQLFRCILSALNQGMLADMLVRLSNTIADDESDIQTFSMEILTTLRKIIEYLDPSDILQYPQLFWATCACLETIHEQEFMESLAMLDRLLDKLDLSNPAVIKLLQDRKPKWEGTFDGVQSSIYKGICSSVCLDRSLGLMQRLALLPSSDLVGNDNRLMYTVLANMPRFLNSFELDGLDQHATSAAEALVPIAETNGCSSLARVLSGFSSSRYRSANDFLLQTVSAIRTAYFPDLDYGCLVFLMSLLTNRLPWVKVKTMQVLCEVIPEIDLRKAEIASKGPDLISPLLRLLQTEFCPEALEVLDHVMTLSGTATPMDRHHLRMSMAGSHSSRALRKEYEKTQSLYGIPEETGWSIPMPAVHSSMTRANVHNVFYTCASADMKVDIDTATPKIEFLAEEDSDSYFPDQRTDTMTSEDARDHVPRNMGSLTLKLDSLDDAFDDDDDTVTASTGPTSPFTSPMDTSMEVRENLYEQQTLPILHKSLTRNASVSSFQTGFADLKAPASRGDPAVMTPTAFTVPTLVPVGLPAPSTTMIRPGLHSRSITSPPLNHVQRTPPSAEASGDEHEESFSDDDVSTGRLPPGGPADKQFSLENVIRPIAQGTRSGFRSGMRRLTGGSGDRERTREAIRQQLQRSPKVPKVPDAYLPNPKSSDL
ncbi:cell morphogenesis protein-like protein [Lineolata rhizophorae]|uniref:Cell morphogenesis protein-like protein n=1 Tax=Lineolata rhizophorae TaxID=578093 RepID=A0A6A6P5S1_9PEZI|nr:cell morphogenesis protein-like protein [Lineolata rhizophorae]